MRITENLIHFIC